ncbi:MAG: hypothetical protein H0U75_09600 [Legionella sp.]|nr:hypothetical protein [Legionella sp.]
MQNAMADIHYPNASSNPESQALYDKGMLNFYAYLYVQAEYDFRQALLYDENCAICHFGIALSKMHQALELGLPFAEVGYADIHKAEALNKTKDGFYFDIIQAAKKAFSLDETQSPNQLKKNYIQALKQVYEKYKKDNTWSVESLALYVNAITISSEDAADNEKPKHFCARKLNGSLKEEAVALMKPILSNPSIPKHPGLMHIYIHLQERDITDPLGMLMAKTLPAYSQGVISHYTHMPNHIYWRRGLYDKAIKANLDAIAIDDQYFKKQGVGLNSYYYEYHYLHSHHFLTMLGVLTNDFDLSLQYAQAVKGLMNPSHLESLKDYRDTFYTLEHLVLLRFNKWQDVLDLSIPPQTGELGHLWIDFAKALSYLQLGDNASFQPLFENIKNKHFASADTRDVQTLALTYLQASQMNLQKKSVADIESLFLKNGVDAIEKKLFVMNPPSWIFPYQLFLSDAAFDRGDLKMAKIHHDLYKKIYPNSTLGKFKDKS